jgi:hypothetical protein
MRLCIILGMQNLRIDREFPELPCHSATDLFPTDVLAIDEQAATEDAAVNRVNDVHMDVAAIDLF